MGNCFLIAPSYLMGVGMLGMSSTLCLKKIAGVAFEIFPLA